MVNMDYLGRTVEFGIVELEQKGNSSLYRVVEPSLAVFFHSKLGLDHDLKIRIELAIVEVLTGDV